MSDSCHFHVEFSSFSRSSISTVPLAAYLSSNPPDPIILSVGSRLRFHPLDQVGPNVGWAQTQSDLTRGQAYLLCSTFSIIIIYFYYFTISSFNYPLPPHTVSLFILFYFSFFKTILFLFSTTQPLLSISKTLSPSQSSIARAHLELRPRPRAPKP